MKTIIGAGIAGLTCAKYLKDRGIEAVILEASDGVGGRVRTDEVNGFKLDRGFQVFLTSYPEAEKLLNYNDLNFKTLPSGARIRNGNDFFVMPNPLKDILTAPQALFSPVGGIFDKLKILQLNLETRNAIEPNIKSEETTIEFLQSFGYSETMIKRFFIPFFSGVFLEKNLETNASFFKFLFSMFSKGDVVIPENGMQAIPEQIAKYISADKIRLNTLVLKIEGTTIYLENGETIEAQKIVLATDAKTAAKLRGEESKTEFNGTSCLYFESDSPLSIDGKPYLMINSNADELINHILPISDVSPNYAPGNKTLISVSIVGNREVATEDVQTELAKWFGNKIDWRHLKTYKIPEALPQFFNGSETENNLRISENLYRFGDHMAYPSLNAAMKTGRQVAEMLSES
ncbi:NAD(P)/FAD-dependent oxidoreductase [soil metagenome]